MGNGHCALARRITFIGSLLDSGANLYYPFYAWQETGRKERFNFLGYKIEVVRNPKTGRTFPLIQPSKEVLVEIKAEIKALTCRKTLCLPKEVVIKKLNETVRGWVGYFYYGNCSRDLSSLKGFLDERVRTYLRRKHGKKSRGYKEHPYQYKIPTTAP